MSLRRDGIIVVDRSSRRLPARNARNPRSRAYPDTSQDGGCPGIGDRGACQNSKALGRAQ